MSEKRFPLTPENDLLYQDTTVNNTFYNNRSVYRPYSDLQSSATSLIQITNPCKASVSLISVPLISTLQEEKAT